MKQFKPFLNDFIKYYYDALDNPTGGYLHICLNDGNLLPEHIWFCQEACRENEDSFGQFLGELMRCFSTEELETLYEKDWWEMGKIK